MGPAEKSGARCGGGGGRAVQAERNAAGLLLEGADLAADAVDEVADGERVTVEELPEAEELHLHTCAHIKQ